jgi:hypothetical protein
MNPSLTSLIYDQCALNQRDNLSTHQFNLIVDPSIVESKQKCYHSQTPFVNNPFNSIPSEYIDIESELNGLSRLNSKCNAKKYHRDTSHQQKLYVKECSGQNDLQIQYTRMKKSHNIKENDEENEKINQNKLYSAVDATSRLENNQRIQPKTNADYQPFDQNTRITLKKFIESKKQSGEWLYQ